MTFFNGRWTFRRGAIQLLAVLVLVLVARVLVGSAHKPPAEPQRFDGVAGITAVEKQSVKALAAAGKPLRLGMLPSNDCYFNAEGKALGFGEELARWLGTFWGVPVEVSRCENEGELRKALREGLVDLAADLPAGAAPGLIQSKPCFFRPIVAFVPASATVTRPDDLSGHALGFFTGSQLPASMRKRVEIPFAPVFADTQKELVNQLRQGQISAIIGEESLDLAYTAYPAIRVVPIFADWVDPMCLTSGREDLRGALAVVDRFLDQYGSSVLSSRHQRATQGARKWKFRSLLSDEERAWIKQRKPVRTLLSPNSFPASFYHEGRFQGVAPDLLALFTEFTGVPVETMSGPRSTTSETLEKLRRGEGQMAAVMMRVPGQEDEFLFSDPYYSDYCALIGHAESSSHTLPEALGKRIGVEKNTCFEAVLDREFPGVRYTLYPDYWALMGALDADDIDLVMLATGEYERQRRVFGSAAYKIDYRLGQKVECRLGFNKDEKHLYSVFNKLLYCLPLQTIRNSWDSYMYDYARRIARLHRNLLFAAVVILIILLIAVIQVYWQQRRLTALREQYVAGREAENRTKSTFLANMSHEIRTPLNAILGFSRLLREKGSLSAEHREWIDTIERSGDHLMDLLNDILEMTKIESGRVTILPRPFDLHALVRDLEAMLRLRADAKNIELEANIRDTVPRYVSADGGKLRQVLMNLLGNAIKFTDRGGVVLRVASNPEPTSGGVRLIFEVEDTGPGIDAEQQNTIFEAFSQGERSGMDAHGGTGLGLAISRQYARLMGGDITFRSTKGKGTLFRVEIPAELSEAILRSSQSLKIVERLVEGQKPPTILIVDDEETNRAMLSVALKTVGFKVVEAAGGAEAIDRIQEMSPDLVLMDFEMPGMNADEVLRRLRAHAAMRTRPVIVFSAHTAEVQSIALAAGANEFLQKPFRLDDLFQSVGRLLHVRYQYMDAPAASTKEDQSGRNFTHLPAEQREALREAAQLADVERLEQLWQDVAVKDAEAGALLHSLVKRFDYAGILRRL